MRSNILIGLVLISCVVATWLFGQFYQELLAAYEQNGTLTQSEYSWVFRLLLNCTGYSTVLLPAFILYKYLEKTNYFDKITNHTWVSRILHACFADQNERLPESIKPIEEGKRETLELLFCFCGLMGAYLVWGLLQEKIMTQDYVLADGAVLRFSDSQLLVFLNRLSALLVALGRLLGSGQRVLPAPLYQFSYCALSNVVSAWCQYEALKYVSFPTQVLSKSCKVIPVMLMGKLISRNKYEPYEYGTALLISVGMAMFMYGSHDDDAGSGWTGASGACLLALYLSCDSFTAAWQGGLFARYPLRPLQMMFAVTLCSCALTAAAVLRAPPAPHTDRRALLQHPGFLADCLLLSGSSALGQVLIYHTIARFGAVVFTIIMTLRQAVSILVSCAVYGHAVSAAGALGVLLVFAAVLLRVHCRRRARERDRERARERDRERARERDRERARERDRPLKPV